MILQYSSIRKENVLKNVMQTIMYSDSLGYIFIFNENIPLLYSKMNI
jgi:hypothetical protein